MNMLAKGDKQWSDVSAKEQMNYLHSLKQPKTDYQRSFAQYKCQNYFRPNVKIICLELFSAFLYVPLLLYYLIKGLTINKQEQSIDAVGEFKGMPEIIPDSINNIYEINNEIWSVASSIAFRDLGFVLSIAMHYLYSPYFALKCLAKVAKYSSFIRLFNPRAIIVHAEYTFTSSVLTAFCEKNGVKHINVMHGEKLVYIGWSFFRFSECYVWGEHYKKLLIDMGAEPTQFIIEIPPALRIDVEANYKQESYTDYKYYLQIYTEDELRSIINSMSFIEKEGKTLCYRPHPRFSDIHLLEKYIPKTMIEYPRETSILTSISSCHTVIGYCSTVLYQAFLCGKEVILDDVTYKQGNEQLKNHRYILSNNPSINSLSSYQ